MMKQSEAAPEPLNDMICNCEPVGCNGETCKCFVSRQSCTAACQCKAALPGLVDIDVDNIHTVCMNPHTFGAIYGMANEVMITDNDDDDQS